jgi:hypothetical protein
LLSNASSYLIRSNAKPCVVGLAGFVFGLPRCSRDKHFKDQNDVTNTETIPPGEQFLDRWPSVSPDLIEHALSQLLAPRPDGRDGDISGNASKQIAQDRTNWNKNDKVIFQANELPVWQPVGSPESSHATG